MIEQNLLKGAGLDGLGLFPFPTTRLTGGFMLAAFALPLYLALFDAPSTPNESEIPITDGLGRNLLH